MRDLPFDLAERGVHHVQALTPTGRIIVYATDGEQMIGWESCRPEGYYDTVDRLHRALEDDAAHRSA